MRDINTQRIARSVFNLFKSGDAEFELLELERVAESRHQDRRITRPVDTIPTARPWLHPTKGYAGAKKRSRRSNRS